MLAVDPRPCKTARKAVLQSPSSPRNLWDCRLPPRRETLLAWGCRAGGGTLNSEVYRSLNPSLRSSSISPKAQAQAMDPHPRHQVLGLLDPNLWTPKRYSQASKILDPKPISASPARARGGRAL